MILYPTETVYGLGVNALNETEWQALCDLKGREETKVASWLVRNLNDIKQYAEVSETATKIAERFLPGPLTLVLPAKESVPAFMQGESGGVSFRISSDPIAQALIETFWQEHNAPLTCTSANVSGLLPEATAEKIIAQFKEHRPGFTGFDQVVDSGERTGEPSTVVSVFGDQVEILREGSTATQQILDCI